MQEAPTAPVLPGGPYFAVGGAIFGNLQPEDVALTAALGYPGIEPYRNHIMQYVEKPQGLKDLLAVLSARPK